MRSSICLLLLMIGLLAEVAAAQQDTAADLSQLNLEQLMKVQFYTASKRAQDASDTPASVTVVTAAEIRTFGYRTLAEVLAGVRGIWINYDRSYSYLGIRGFARPGDYNTHILLQVNGHRLNDDVEDGALLGTEFPLDIDLIERIEIVRGPSSSLYGTNAFFGVVNIITRKPPLTAKAEVSADIGSNVARRGRVTIGLPQLLNGALFSASLYQSPGVDSLYFPEFDLPQTNNGIAKRADGDRSGSAFALLQWKHFELQALVGSRRKLVPTAAYGSVFNDPINQVIDSRGFVDLSYNRHFVSGMQLTARWFYDAYSYHGIYSFDQHGLGVVGRNDTREDWVGSEVNLSRPVGHHNTLTAGMEFRYDLRQIQQVHASILPDPVFDDRRTASVFAFYAQDEIALTPRLSLTAGVRLDQYSTFGTASSPRIAAVYHPDAKTTVKYILGRAFRAPSASEEYSGDGVTSQANPALRPETIVGHNVGVERTLTPGLHVSAEVYLNHMDRLIDTTINPHTGLLQYVNAHSYRGRGVQLELDAQRGGWRAGLTYTLQKSDEAQTHAAIANAPLHLGKFKLQAPVHNALTAAIEMQYISPQQTYNGDRIPDRLNTNLTLSSRKPVLGFDISASCYNLFDRHNYDPVAPYLRQLRILLDGREFRVKITRSFSRN